MFVIYKATSPSGRYYIGLTKNGIKERWRQHVMRANKGLKHPLWAAIRKYGPESFILEEIDSCKTLAEAQKLEILYISKAQPDRPYNISPGGDEDGAYGSKCFWDAINADPEARETYLKKLSNIKLANDWTDYADLTAKSAQWRIDNPRLAWKTSYRAIRIANRIASAKSAPKIEDTRPLVERLRWKHNRSGATRIQTTALWAGYSEEKKAEIASNISSGKIKQWASMTYAERLNATAYARSCIDVKIQGPAASRGIKKFWEDLKKNPVEYARYMKARTESLMKTLEMKKCVPTT